MNSTYYRFHKAPTFTPATQNLGQDPGVNSDDGVKSDVDEDKTSIRRAVAVVVVGCSGTGTEKKLSTALRH